MRFGLHKLWNCCRANTVATMVMFDDNGRPVAYPACGACASAYSRYNGTVANAGYAWGAK